MFCYVYAKKSIITPMKTSWFISLKASMCDVSVNQVKSTIPKVPPPSKEFDQKQGPSPQLPTGPQPTTEKQPPTSGLQQGGVMTHVVRCYQHSLAPNRGIDASGMILDSSKFRENFPPVWFCISHTHQMGRLYIYLHGNHKNQPNVGKYTRPMDGMGF